MLVQILWLSITSSKKVILGLVKERTENLTFLKELIEAGKIKIVIDRTYPLSDSAKAHKYSESGHAKGEIVITVQHNNKT